MLSQDPSSHSSTQPMRMAAEISLSDLRKKIVGTPPCTGKVRRKESTAASGPVVHPTRQITRVSLGKSGVDICVKQHTGATKIRHT